MYSKVRYITPEAPPSPRVRKMANNTYVGNKAPAWEKTQASGAGSGASPALAIEIMRIEKKWNIEDNAIADAIYKMLKSYSQDKVVLYYHSTWGSCRVTKFIVLNSDGTYIDSGDWIDNSSRKNVYKLKIMSINEFIAKFASRELLAYLYVSPSCNTSKQYSFKAVFRIKGEQ